MFGVMRALANPAHMSSGLGKNWWWIGSAVA